jgi:hypothetical protein
MPRGSRGLRELGESRVQYAKRCRRELEAAIAERDALLRQAQDMVPELQRLRARLRRAEGREGVRAGVYGDRSSSVRVDVNASARRGS